MRGPIVSIERYTPIQGPHTYKAILSNQNICTFLYLYLIQLINETGFT